MNSETLRAVVQRTIEPGQGQNHHAVAGGCRAAIDSAYGIPTRYREVVLTVSKIDD